MDAYDCVIAFREREHADQFMRGDLRLTRLATYRSIESHIPGVQDAYEGKTKIDLPEGPEFFIDARSLRNGGYDGSGQYEWMKIPSGYLGQSFRGCDDVFVICATDLSMALECGNRSDTASETALELSPGYLRFAEKYRYVVFFDSREIASRLWEFAKEHHLDFTHGLVEYYDESLSIDEAIAARDKLTDAHRFVFTKDESFSDQHEYRFALLPTLEQIEHGERLNPGCDFLIAKVGEIGSMCIPTDYLSSMSFQNKG